MEPEREKAWAGHGPRDRRGLVMDPEIGVG